jgi:siroheme synthase (precorrin-2 oxidase/ferrochelatase)
VTTVLVVGAGAVGTRAARQLLDTPGVERVMVADLEARRRDDVVDALGGGALATDYLPGDEVPPVDAIACAVPTGVDHAVVTAAIAAGIPVASSDDDQDALEAVRALTPNASGAGVTIALGCGLAPGLADVLARHAADAFAAVDEIKVARTGWAGPASMAAVRHARRAMVRTWHDGSWRVEQPHGDSLVWFPEPIGGRDCRPVTGGVALLVDAFPKVARISVLLGEPPKRTRWRRRFGDDGEWGATRVEVWGRGDDGHDCIVYGVVERTAVAAGTVLAVTAARLAGALGERLVRPGVFGVAELVEPVPFLAELAQRGVRAAVFEGARVG